jgi:translation initiation factor eIF-2B subunit delta
MFSQSEVAFNSSFSSSLLREVFQHAKNVGKEFRVIVADGRPRFEGREMMRHLVNYGIEVSYIQLSSVPYVMPEVI